MKKWTTAISTRKDGELYIKGKKLSSLIEKHDFIDVIFLLWRGSLPKKKEARIFNALLVAASEHGLEAPSTFSARTAISTGNPLQVALASGILTLGDFHGGAIEKAAFLIQSKIPAAKIVRGGLVRKERIPGFGHKFYKGGDPRVFTLFSMAKKLGFFGKSARKALLLEKELKKQTGSFVPLNIDGAMAALISELGFDWRLARGVFVLARLAGLVAHVHEELMHEKPYRRLDEADIEYLGPRPK